jgi:hypothetical protein
MTSEQCISAAWRRQCKEAQTSAVFPVEPASDWILDARYGVAPPGKGTTSPWHGRDVPET